MKETSHSHHNFLSILSCGDVEEMQRKYLPFSKPQAEQGAHQLLLSFPIDPMGLSVLWGVQINSWGRAGAEIWSIPKYDIGR